jgi:hypothetical protein
MTPTEAAFIVSGLAAVLLSCWRISRYVTKANPSAEGAVFLRLLIVSLAAVGVAGQPADSRGPLWFALACCCVLAGFWWVPAPTDKGPT